VFENRVLRRIFGPKRNEATGRWRELHNEELRDLYSSPSIIRMIKSRRVRWVGHLARMGEEKNAYRLLVGKQRSRKTDVGRWRDGMGWCGLAQDRNKWRALVSAVMNLRVPLNAGKLPSGYITRGLSSSAQLHIVS
jgi:hypothetical protein